jgi:hypothetical protein
MRSEDRMMLGGGETVQTRVQGDNRDKLYEAANAVLSEYFGTAGYRILQFEAEAVAVRFDGQVIGWQADVTATAT